MTLSDSASLFALAGLAVLLLAGLGFAVYCLVTTRRRNADLEESLTAYRMLFDSNPNPMYVYDVETFTLLAANKTLCERYGYAQEELVGTSLMQLHIESERHVLRQVVADLRETRNPHFRYKWLQQTKTGEIVPVEIFSRPFRHGDRDARLVVAIDISDRLHAEDDALRQKRFSESLLEVLPVPVFSKDREGRYLGINKAFAQFFGASPEVLIGKTAWDIAPAELAARYQKADDELYDQPGSVQVYSTQVSTKGLGLRDVEFTKAVFRDAKGDVAGLVGAVLDVTERNRAAEAIQALNEQLEARVRERTADLAKANEDLHVAMKQLVQAEKLAALGSLVAGVAHELNTPLGNVLTVATALKERTDTFGEIVASGGIRRSEITEFINACNEASAMVERNAQRAATLIGNFKEVAVDQTSMRRRRFDLAKIIAETLSTMHPTLKRTEHEIAVDIPAGIQLDSYPGPLEQIISNLLLNALLHGFEGIPKGRIEVSAAEQNGRVQISFRDNGVGMTSHVAEHAFDPFYTTRLGKGGSGLGLYLCYNLTTAILGGRIFLASAPGQGAEFHLDLPLSAPVAADSAG